MLSQKFKKIPKVNTFVVKLFDIGDTTNITPIQLECVRAFKSSARTHKDLYHYSVLTE